MARPDASFDERALIPTEPLTDNSGGTASDTIGSITADASVTNAIASLTAKVNELIRSQRGGVT